MTKKTYLASLKLERAALSAYKRARLKAYRELCDRVAELDKAAAKYLRGAAKKLSTFIYCGSLPGCFIWRDTPQGALYWTDLNLELNAAKPKSEPRAGVKPKPKKKKRS